MPTGSSGAAWLEPLYRVGGARVPLPQARRRHGTPFTIQMHSSTEVICDYSLRLTRATTVPSTVGTALHCRVTAHTALHSLRCQRQSGRALSLARGVGVGEDEQCGAHIELVPHSTLRADKGTQ